MPKLILVSSFLFALLLVVFMQYGQTEQAVVGANYDPLPSENCVKCHTNATAITALTKEGATMTGGG